MQLYSDIIQFIWMFQWNFCPVPSPSFSLQGFAVFVPGSSLSEVAYAGISRYFVPPYHQRHKYLTWACMSALWYCNKHLALAYSCRGFHPWLLGSIVLGPMEAQYIMIGSGQNELLTKAWERRKKEQRFYHLLMLPLWRPKLFHKDLWGIFKIQTTTTNPEPCTENVGLKIHSIQQQPECPARQDLLCRVGWSSMGCLFAALLQHLGRWSAASHQLRERSDFKSGVCVSLTGRWLHVTRHCKIRKM